MNVCPVPAMQMLLVQTHLEHTLVDVILGMSGMDLFVICNLKVIILCQRTACINFIKIWQCKDTCMHAPSLILRPHLQKEERV